MSDNLTVFGTNYTNVTGIKAKGTSNGTLTYIRPTGTKSITENGTTDVTNYANVNVNVNSGVTVTQIITSGTEIASINADGISTSIYIPTPVEEISISSTEPTGENDYAKI